MIITVTMNPAIDKTCTIGEFCYGGLNRIQQMIMDVGGKGINVSKMIHSLGGKSVAAGFIGGSNGIVIERNLKYKGIATDFIIVQGETRCNLKLVDDAGTVTEINEPGPVIDRCLLEIFIRKLDNLYLQGSIVVLTGSLPKEMDKTIYRELTDIIHEKGGIVFLDADDEAFFYGLEAKPDFIKPNLHELQKYFGRQGHAEMEDLIKMGKQLLDKGIGNILLTMGPEGALFFVGHRIIYAKGLNVEVKSSVGAGDALLAAYALGIDEGLGVEENIKRAVAASAGAVMKEGTNPPSEELVKKLQKKVNIEYLI